MKVHLKVVEGKPLGASILLPHSMFMIGRDPMCHLRPKHDSVGTKHCSLSVRDDHVDVEDLGSEGGTLLNGRRLRPEEPAEAFHGDRLQVGNLVFEVSIGASTPKPEAAKSPAVNLLPGSDADQEDSAAAIAHRLIQQSLGKGPDPVKAVGSHLRAEMVDGIPWISIQMARIVDDQTILPFKRELRNLSERPTLTRVVLDFHHVKVFSAEAADVLIAFHERLKGRKAKLKLCEVSSSVLRVLHEKGLDSRIPICLDCHDAIWSSW